MFHGQHIAPEIHALPRARLGENESRQKNNDKRGEAKYAVATASHRVVSAWYLQLIGAEANMVGYKSTIDATNDLP